MSKVVLVTGATGKQGGAVIDGLVNDPQFTLVALTRDPESSGAKRLAAKSEHIKVIQGNLDDSEAVLKKAIEVAGPVWGVFSVQLAIGSGATPVTEERQGKALADAALAANVKYFIYSSVDRGGEAKTYDNPTNVPHFISKHNIEHHLIDKIKTGGSKMDYTILRPTGFMDNMTNDFMGKTMNTTMRNSLKDTSLQLIATKDIGRIAAKAFSNPESYKGRAISLAGDDLTFAQQNEIFKKHTGHDIPTTFGVVPAMLLLALKDIKLMMQWFVSDGYGTDIPALRRELPELMDFETWLKTESAWKTSA